MKTIITIFFLLNLYIGNTYAQQKYTTGVLTANKIKYIVTTSDGLYPNKYVSIRNSQNQYYNERMHSNKVDYISPDLLGAKVNTDDINKIYMQEVGPQIFQTLANDLSTWVLTQIKFSKEGKVLEIIFFTKNTTPITPVMFENIEARIKKEIHVTFNQFVAPNIGVPLYQTLNIYNFDYEIHFNKLKVN